ncbi:hypothetical protein BLA60_03670 [Actinophytocola xinjiangensis]|uniref:Eis-like acetyltransferase domain-containing protein n=1 Tax=Actinophytocola xinjiangensis TaxID=485602 RepID=A0A7Z1B0W9_9PSEU|nr:hypothetical protein [Actinophytocola xinjiangensis]OLF14243.1 hypothetical protein BLA60_03670 [Actinophytocola xinjiangensis]
MRSDITIENLRAELWPAAFEVHEHAFGGVVDERDRDLWWDTLDPDLSFAAVTGAGEVVAVQAGLRTDLGLRDGSRVAATVGCFGGVALPYRGGGTHFALCRAQGDQATRIGAEAAVFKAASVPLSRALNGNPAGIAVDVAVTPEFAREVKPSPGMSFEVVPADQSVDRCREIYQATAEVVPGMPVLPKTWWLAHTLTSSGSKPFCLLATSADGDEGYLRFGIAPHWVGGVGHSEFQAQELISPSPRVRDALALAALNFDHVTRVSIENCMLSDAIRWVRGANRGIEVRRMYDYLWVALLDTASDRLRAQAAETDFYCPFIV